MTHATMNTTKPVGTAALARCSKVLQHHMSSVKSLAFMVKESQLLVCMGMSLLVPPMLQQQGAAIPHKQCPRALLCVHHNEQLNSNNNTHR